VSAVLLMGTAQGAANQVPTDLFQPLIVTQLETNDRSGSDLDNARSAHESRWSRATAGHRSAAHVGSRTHG
jgi:hypothetical protein